MNKNTIKTITTAASKFTDLLKMKVCFTKHATFFLSDRISFIWHCILVKKRNSFYFSEIYI